MITVLRAIQRQRTEPSPGSPSGQLPIRWECFPEFVAGRRGLQCQPDQRVNHRPTTFGALLSAKTRAVGGLVGLNEGYVSYSSFAGFVQNNDLIQFSGVPVGGLVGVNRRDNPQLGVVGVPQFQRRATGGGAIGGLVAINKGLITGSQLQTSHSTCRTPVLAGWSAVNDKVRRLVVCHWRGDLERGIGAGWSATTPAQFVTSYAIGNVAVSWTRRPGRREMTARLFHPTQPATSMARTVTDGLVGGNGGIIQNSYATGAVQEARDAGGFVGWNAGSIASSFATGTVTGTSPWLFGAGGFVGPSPVPSSAPAPRGPYRERAKWGSLVGSNGPRRG